MAYIIGESGYEMQTIPHTGLNNECLQTKHFAHSQWRPDISDDSGEKKITRVSANTHVHLHAHSRR